MDENEANDLTRELRRIEISLGYIEDALKPG